MGNEGQAALACGAFQGREGFQQLVRDALAAAAREGWREIILCDPDFEDWPLHERATVQALGDWSRAGRKCILLARRWDGVIRRHARFVAWRGMWSHIVEARGCASADPLELPSALWTPGWVMERHDVERCRGTSGAEPQRRLLLREKINDWLSKSTPAFPATTLGL